MFRLQPVVNVVAFVQIENGRGQNWKPRRRRGPQRRRRPAAAKGHGTGRAGRPGPMGKQKTILNAFAAVIMATATMAVQSREVSLCRAARRAEFKGHQGQKGAKQIINDAARLQHIAVAAGQKPHPIPGGARSDAQPGQDSEKIPSGQQQEKQTMFTRNKKWSVPVKRIIGAVTHSKPAVRVLSRANSV